MTRLKTASTPGGSQTLPWTDPDLPPGQFLYERQGPWPQPAPAYPMQQAREVLNIPPIESLVWNQFIGSRYLTAQLSYGATAARLATGDMTQPVLADAEFADTMTLSVYARFLRDTKVDGIWVSDFTAMELIDPLPGTFCAPVVCRFKKAKDSYSFSCVDITFQKTPGNKELKVTPLDKAWNLAKIYACQGAAYHALFVNHTALHFPMDSVNAITKTAVPHTHPLFQLLYPHTSFTLALDNAVQEGAGSVVGNNADATWFDPVTANGYNVKQLFGVGYSGYKGLAAYPAYDYMSPWMDRSTPFGDCLATYFKPFWQFCTKVASVIPKNDPYVTRWAEYCSGNVLGFPDGSKIFDQDKLVAAMAIYMWDVTVAHGADHYSFAGIPSWNKFLRIRKPPPASVKDGEEIKLVGDVCSADDLTRAEMAREMFFASWTMPPNLIQTDYAFTDPSLRKAIDEFRGDLRTARDAVSGISKDFMPLETDPKNPDGPPYSQTIPASIQY